MLCSDTDVESDAMTTKCKKQKNKPLMEKKRRARINRSLSQLKQILIQDEHKNSSQHSKWEKADILEMAVEYLEILRSSRHLRTPKPPTTPTTSTPSTPIEHQTQLLAPPMLTYQMNPMVQQYMAYQQLSQLAMYQRMVGVSGVGVGVGMVQEKTPGS